MPPCKNQHRLLATAGLVTALFLATAHSAAAASHPAYCSKLQFIADNWRTVCTKHSRVQCQGHALDDRRHEVVRRLANAAKLAASSGRADVAKALKLSSLWVASSDSAVDAYHARQMHLGEQMAQAGRKANVTLGTDCGFAPYPKRIQH